MNSQRLRSSKPHAWRTLAWWLVGAFLLLGGLAAGPHAWAADLGSCGQATVPGPCAKDDGAVSEDGKPVTINVLANDRDRSHTGLRVTAVTQPRHGQAKINADFTITYTPNKKFDGVDSFYYTVTDGLGITARAKVVVRVEAKHPPHKGHCHVRPIDRDEDGHERFVYAQETPGGASVPVVTSFYLPPGGLPITVAPTETLTIIFTPIITPTGNIAAPPDSPLAQGGAPSPLRYVWTDLSFELELYLDEEPLQGMQFVKPLEVTILYPDELVAGLDESTLTPYYWTPDGWSQVGITVISRDPATNTIVFQMDGIVGEVSLFAQPPLLFLPALRGK